MNIKLNILIILTLVIIIGMLFTPSSDEYSSIRYILNGVGLTLIPFLGAWIGMDALKFFTVKSTFGKAIFFISIALITYGLGTLVFFYYNMFLQTEIPYPSLADVGFSATIVFANYGMFILLKNIKMKFDKLTILKLIIFPLIVFAVITPVFFYERAVEDAPLFTKILNIYYVVGDALFLSFAFLILVASYGSILFKAVRIIAFGFILQSIADFSFMYTATAGIYYTSCWVDVIYCFALFTIGYGIYYLFHQSKAKIADMKKLINN